MPRRRLRGGAIPGAFALAAVALTLTGAVRAADDPLARAWRAVFGERAKPASRGEQRVLVVLTAPSLADRMAVAETPRPRQQRRWTADAAGAQRLLLAALRERGLELRRDEIFTRTFNGFSAEVDPRALAELERASGIAGIYPVRTVYPAANARPDPGDGGAASSEVSLPGFDGRGVTVALLDTGVQRRHPYLRGRVLRGFDLVDEDRDTAPETKPDEPGLREMHGTRMAGLVVGRGGPGGLAGVAPRAKVLPIRVVGWERTEDGSHALLGRGDLLLAGLERAVDPNRDGSVEDAARIVLAPVVEPYAAFADSPEARAVAGAARLGALVVAPAGNDGGAGFRFGATGAPGTAPDALAVGAVDARRRVLEADAALFAGDDEVLEEPIPLLGRTRPQAPAALSVASLAGPTLADPGRRSRATADGSRLGDFFDRKGVSLVAGRAVLVDAGGAALEQKAWNARVAGATAVLVHGSGIAAAGLELDEGGVPVLALPDEAAGEALAALEAGEPVTLVLEAAAPVENPAAMDVAPFSSGGVAFDGRVKPDLVAPGVGLVTAAAAPGGGYTTATGTSAAAAVAAGAAALMAQARPDLSALELKSLLVGSAEPLSRDGTPLSVTTQGAGLVRPERAATAGLVVEPATLAFGRAEGAAWRSVRTVSVRNVSAQPLEVTFGVAPEGGPARSLAFAASPTRLSLRPGESGEALVQVSVRKPLEAGAGGAFVVTAEGAQAVRVPWAVAPRGDAAELVDDLRISNTEFSPSNAAPAIVAFQAGRVDASADGEAIEPVGLLELELWTETGRRLGVLARMRDVLPGRYAFGLTGRGPNGRVLDEGTYVLRLRAHAVDAEDGERPSTAQTVFTIE